MARRPVSGNILLTPGWVALVACPPVRIALTRGWQGLSPKVRGPRRERARTLSPHFPRPLQTHRHPACAERATNAPPVEPFVAADTPRQPNGEQKWPPEPKAGTHQAAPKTKP